MALIHTCYRITDIDQSVAFYEALGFQEVGRIPIRDEAAAGAHFAVLGSVMLGASTGLARRPPGGKR